VSESKTTNPPAPNSKHRTQQKSLEFEFAPLDNERLLLVNGECNENLRLIERRLGVEINNRGEKYRLTGSKRLMDATSKILHNLYQESAQNRKLSTMDVHMQIQVCLADSSNTPFDADEISITTKRGAIKPKGENQAQYISKILTNDVNFGIGPAGTGKTYLAVAAAVDALERQTVRRIILTRPAVEAGERLGFLPGDLASKIDPYLRPLYDALYEMLGFETVAKLMEKNIIEVAPLAYMRGRTLNESFIILDESQNTTAEQMKMFLTRLGFQSKAVITGDVTQIDLPGATRSGLKHAIEVFEDVKGISFTFFRSKDVVRHEIVQRIVEAYEKHEANDDSSR
jgi:phosphate starvation-inducible PhoH-like protein